ncbi:MAG: response regulator RpfG family c-di-GMP phosphodiesterase [Acidimicrobiales bacterium]|jgi:response regulator RpfG family c-di-GMP phosphodiesterase
MPEMNGAEFLARVSERRPKTQRILLSGQADLDSTVAAVNEGGIFRFLLKPCSKEKLVDAITAAFEISQLREVETHLLEGTLQGALGILSEILAIVSPPAFQSTRRIESIIDQLVVSLALPDGWQFRVAATLSQVGCVAVPVAILDRVASGEKLDEADAEVFAGHVTLANQLVGRIPRLENVSSMILGHLEPTNVDPSNLQRAGMPPCLEPSFCAPLPNLIGA